MQRVGFKMKLHQGCEAEYEKRHQQLWPELEALLKNSGISDYSIFLDRETLSLFGVLKVTDATRLDELPSDPVMQRWWTYMKDIMDTNADDSPVSVSLREVFYLP
jgi:L-rhamnose mutarotase